jgi:prevent-host-death family protein
MTRRYTATTLRADLYRVLDQVLETGTPVEIDRNGKVLRLEAVAEVDRLAAIRPHPDFIPGDPESIAHLAWPEEWRA